ncbi:MAG: glycosyltransferase family 1 protein [Bacteroidota bacterium]
MSTPFYINGRFLTQVMTGIQRFSFELCKMLIEQGVDIVILAPRKIRLEYKLNCHIIQFGLFNTILWEQIDLPRFLQKHKKPLLINFGSPGPLCYANRIVTIHDLAIYVHPGGFSRPYYYYYRFVTPVFTRRSKKIITVSEFSKQEIVRLTGVAPEKIVVIHNAVSAAITNSDSAVREIKQPYILSVASMDPRKNLARLVEAYNKLGLASATKLVLAGKMDSIFTMELSHDIVANSLGYVPDEALAVLYKNASVFVYLSIYEGFGIPPLEAMAMGCPVVLSDIAVFREIFGDAACYVDPLNSDSISQAILLVMNNKSYRNQLVARGFERVKLYSWEKSAAKLLALINSME